MLYSAHTPPALVELIFFSQITQSVQSKALLTYVVFTQKDITEIRAVRR